MKKVSITGGSGLIGSEIVNLLSCENEIVLIKERLQNIDAIIEQVYDSDVFINNAMHEWGQVNLLFRLYKIWQKEDKLIINIGSRAAAPNVSKGFEYSTVKAAINHFSDLVKFKDDQKVCRVTTINPGLVRKMDNYSLNASYIAELISWLLNQPSYVEISRIDLSHVAPYELVQKLKNTNLIK